MNAVYELLPMLDTPGYSTLVRAENERISFYPSDVCTRHWQAPRLASTWRPREVRVHPTATPVNDYPTIGLLVPAFSERAVRALRNLLEPNGEILPLKCDAGQYYAYNITTIADVLNHKESEVDWMDPREPVLASRIIRYEFYPDRVDELSIFRIPEHTSKHFVTERFAEQVREHGLRGFNLRKVWPGPERSELEAYYRAKRQRKGDKGEPPPSARARKGPSSSPKQRLGKKASAANPQPAEDAVLDLRRESEAIESMLRSAFDRYAVKHAHALAREHHPPVRAIVLIYSVAGGYVHLRLDGWSDKAPDGGKSYPQFGKLERPHWRQWAEPDEGEMVEIITSSGERQWIHAEEELTVIIGQMLVESLKRARDTGMLSKLPMGQGCELAVEEIDWNYGWPSAEERGRDNMVT